MRLEFIFSRSPNIQSEQAARVKTHFLVPDESQNLIEVEKRVREIGRCVGVLTQASLHFTCADMGIHEERMNEKQLDTNDNRFFILPFALNIYFKTYRNSRTLHVVAPHDPMELNVPSQLISKSVSGRKKRGRKPKLADHVSVPSDSWCETDEQYAYVNALKTIIEQAEVLLNAAPNPYRTHAYWSGFFHPYWHDSTVSQLLGKEHVRLTQPDPKPTKKSGARRHGKGNRPGAIPGKFKGVQFRSQLEIRFATQMESRGISWIYEEERLGDGNYLVDFHLPDLKMWVEVKGQFTPRDHYLLKDVAQALQERGESLYVFTSGSPMKVTPEGFDKLPRKAFWELLEQRSK